MKKVEERDWVAGEKQNKQGTKQETTYELGNIRMLSGGGVAHRSTPLLTNQI